MLILFFLYVYGRALAPKGRVCLLGGRDFFDSDQRVSSFLLLFYLQLSVYQFVRNKTISKFSFIE